MTRLPDPDRSRALLIGTGAHADRSDLPALPAVAANLADLRQVLTDPATGSLPPQHCVTVADPVTASEVGSPLARLAQEATDLLLVYYGGHGLVDDRGRLHLALPHTDATDIRWTALPFETLREELADSPAAIRVLVLDCCFSGRAIEAMTSGHSTVAGQIDIAGTYTLASTSANAVAYAPEGATHTAFTGALLAALRGPAALNLDQLFDEVRRDLAVRGMPRPQRRVVNNAGDLVLVRPPDPAAPSPAPASEPPAAAWTEPDASTPPRSQPALTRPTPRPRLYPVAVAALLLFQLMVVLVETATEAGTFSQPGAPVGAIEWFSSAYLLTFAATLPVAGRVSDAWGRRRVFAAGAVIFCLASLLGPLASTTTLLLASRVFQGAGAALGTVGVIALVAGRFRPPLAIGLLGVTVITGPVLGRQLGDALISGGTRMVVLGIPALPTALFGLIGWGLIDRAEPERIAATTRQRWATAGVSLWMCTLAYAIDRVGKNGWTDPTASALIAAAAVAGIVWALRARQLRRPDALFGILAGRQWIGALVGTAGVGGTLTAVEWLLSRWALAHGSTVLWTVAAAALSAALAAPYVRRRFGSKPERPAILSVLLVAIGLFWLSRAMHNGAGYWTVLWPLLLTFIGGGLAMAIFAITALAHVSLPSLGTASALLGAGQWVAAALPANALASVVDSIANPPRHDSHFDMISTFFKVATWAFTVGAAFQLPVLVVCALALRRGTRERPAARTRRLARSADHPQVR
ncbi:MFS transporter [Streptomyces sp. CG1]|uniref:caspase, EACC1-associated type n=1 Tax=Streptomyces sp. CG1 TaxID=1287523 RepID=UPI0034E2C6CC